MVGWVLEQRGEGPAVRLERGFNGRIATDPAAAGTWVLEASFEDGGGEVEAVPSRRAVDRVVLRSRRVEAEHASARHGTQVLQSEGASGGAFIGAIHPGHHLRFDGVDLTGILRVRIAVSSAGAGGLVELRRGAPDGPVLASFTVEVNGAWEEWYLLELVVDPPPGKDDLYVLFTKREGGGALMNLDWLRFETSEDSAGEPAADGG